VIVTLLVLATLYADHLAKPELAIWTGLLTAMVASFALYKVCSQPIRLDINSGSDEIAIKYRSWSPRRTKRFTLTPFSLVRSYSGGGSHPLTIVELATTEEVPRAIRLAIYEEPLSKENNFLAIPRFIEAPEARLLRTRLVETGHFRDQGYLGDFLERRAKNLE
jgi:hypothetical protein